MARPDEKEDQKIAKPPAGKEWFVPKEKKHQQEADDQTQERRVEEPPVAGDQPAPIVVRGDQVYAGVCQPCHQAHGHGIPGQYPPLVGSDWLLEDHETPIRILLHGLSGPVVIKGRTYNNRMPPFHDKLSNEEIAAVITYARSGWGNNAPPVTPALVDSIRQQTQGRSEWTAAELLKLRPPQLTKK